MQLVEHILAAYCLIYLYLPKGLSPMFHVNCRSLVANCFTLMTVMGLLIVLEYDAVFVCLLGVTTLLVVFSTAP
jgi:hypothetical protein